jgi:hypothetical protein
MGGPSSFSISLQPGYGPTSVPIPYGYQQYPQANQNLPFLHTLDLPHVLFFKNVVNQHSPFCPAIPTKLPSDISKFDGKPREDPNNYFMNFHLWFSSNSLMDYSILLRII